LIRTEKEKIVADLHDNFKKSKVVILTDYKGLDVSAISKLRRKLREVDVEYKVVKNTLITIASEDTDAALIKDYFKGPSALALSYDDPVAPAKVLVDFAKENDKLEIQVGVMEGRVISLNEIKALSSLPSREILLGQLLSAMNGVATAFVRVLNGMPVKLLNVMQAIRDQKESA
jgi:large subunit ribosomal protein L10